jgi:hypothetical protein
LYSNPEERCPVRSPSAKKRLYESSDKVSYVKNSHVRTPRVGEKRTVCKKLKCKKLVVCEGGGGKTLCKKFICKKHACKSIGRRNMAQQDWVVKNIRVKKKQTRGIKRVPCVENAQL